MDTECCFHLDVKKPATSQVPKRPAHNATGPVSTKSIFVTIHDANVRNETDKENNQMLDSIGEFYRTSSKTVLIIDPHLFGKEQSGNVRRKRVIASVHVQAAVRVGKLYMVRTFTHSCFRMNMIVLQPAHNRSRVQRRDSIPRTHLAQVVWSCSFSMIAASAPVTMA